MIPRPGVGPLGLVIILGINPRSPPVSSASRQGLLDDRPPTLLIQKNHGYLPYRFPGLKN